MGFRFESGRSGETGVGAWAQPVELTAHDSGLCGFASNPSPSHVQPRVQPPVEGREIWLVGEQQQEAPADRRRDTIRLGKGSASLCSPLAGQEVEKLLGIPFRFGPHEKEVAHDVRRGKRTSHDVQREKQTSHDVRRVKQIAEVGRIRRRVLVGDRPANKPLARRKRS